jgi:hypothetical protein
MVYMIHMKITLQAVNAKREQKQEMAPWPKSILPTIILSNNDEGGHAINISEVVVCSLAVTVECSLAVAVRCSLIAVAVRCSLMVVVVCNFFCT